VPWTLCKGASGSPGCSATRCAQGPSALSLPHSSSLRKPPDHTARRVGLRPAFLSRDAVSRTAFPSRTPHEFPALPPFATRAPLGAPGLQTGRLQWLQQPDPPSHPAFHKILGRAKGGKSGCNNRIRLATLRGAPRARGAAAAQVAATTGSA
jgi:hypothetical protein